MSHNAIRLDGEFYYVSNPCFRNTALTASMYCSRASLMLNAILRQMAVAARKAIGFAVLMIVTAAFVAIYFLKGK